MGNLIERHPTATLILVFLLFGYISEMDFKDSQCDIENRNNPNCEIYFSGEIK